MDVVDTPIAGLKVITPKRFADARGFFSETFSERVFQPAGITDHFVQDNHSLSVDVGVLRGLHYQTAPHAQAKLIRVSNGAILDVVVDIRKNSPTFGQHFAIELSRENWRQLYVPVGFAHGFITLEPNTEVIYKVTAFYSPECDRGIRWNDARIGINWSKLTSGLIDRVPIILSPKDQQLPFFDDVVDWF